MVNYLLVSPFTICGKILERIIFNQVFGFIEKKTNYFPPVNQVFDQRTLVKMN